MATEQKQSGVKFKIKTRCLLWSGRRNNDCSLKHENQHVIVFIISTERSPHFPDSLNMEAVVNNDGFYNIRALRHQCQNNVCRENTIRVFPTGVVDLQCTPDVFYMLYNRNYRRALVSCDVSVQGIC